MTSTPSSLKNNEVPLKRFFLVRHAHRHVVDPHEDNGLSEKGLAQSKALRDFFLEKVIAAHAQPSKRLVPKLPLLISSPRLRCQETLQPMALDLGVDLHIEELLDEGARQKRSLDLRVADFSKWLRKSDSELIIACSHGDWIPLFFLHACGVEDSLKKSGFCEFELRQDRFTIKQIHGPF